MKTCSKCGVGRPIDQFYADGRSGRATAECKLCHNARTRAWYSENKERAAEQVGAWRRSNPEKVRAYEAKWRQENRDKARAKDARHRKAFPWRHAAKSAIARARRLGAAPSWVDVRGLSAWYLRAVCVSRVTGVKHHVDHIVPLRGFAVSGLHVPWNLQLIPDVQNMRKGRARWGDE